MLYGLPIPSSSNSDTKIESAFSLQENPPDSLFQELALAAKRATPDERMEMRRLGVEIKRYAAARDGKRYLRANGAVHEIKARAAQNATLEKIIGTINGRRAVFGMATLKTQDSPRKLPGCTIISCKRSR